MEVNTVNTLKNLAIVAILLGVACLVYANRRRLLKVHETEQDKKPTRDVNSRDDAMTEVCQTFLMYADVFQGIFEPLYKASIGTISKERCSNVMTEWDIRMNGIGNTPICLKSWWSTIVDNLDSLSEYELQNRAKHVIQMIQSSGIIRDDRTELVAVNDTSLYYQHSDGIKWTVGQKLQITSPCWYMQSTPIRIIEKGYCEII